jgi:hypothetical protein
VVEEEECRLLGMAIKFAGICGKEIQILAKEQADCGSNRNHPLNLRATYDSITVNYPRISAMRIVTAVTRPRMSASPG